MTTTADWKPSTRAERRATSRQVREFPPAASEGETPLTVDNRPRLQAGDALLLRAAADGDVDEVARLLEYDGASPNAHDVNRTTAAHMAAKSGNMRLLDLLSEHGADLDRREAFSVGAATPLILAIQYNQPDAAEMLIESGVDIHAPQAETGLTPLHLCAQKSDGSMNDTAALLVARGVDVHKGDADGANAAYWAQLCGNEEFNKIDGVGQPQTASTEEVVIKYLQGHEQAEKLGGKSASGGKKKGKKKKKK